MQHRAPSRVVSTAPSRRLLLAGLGGLLATPVAARAIPSAAEEVWLAYEARLRARVADAGGGAFQAASERELLSLTNAARSAVGAPAEPFTVPAFSLIPARRTLAGSTTGGIAEIEEMLAFCAERGIHPETELVAADAINDAWARVLSSEVRYRFVIDTHTL